MKSENPTIIFARKIAIIIAKEMELDLKSFNLYQSTSSNGRVRLEILTQKNDGMEIRYNGFSIDIRKNRGTLGYTDQWQQIPLAEQ